jgi:hypothetical protein
MSRKDFVVLASRVIALYFIFWALDNLSQGQTMKYLLRLLVQPFAARENLSPLWSSFFEATFPQLTTMS